MNDSIEEPSLSSRTFARVVSISQLISIGPLALTSTIITVLCCSLLCLPCIVLTNGDDNDKIIYHDKKIMKRCGRVDMNDTSYHSNNNNNTNTTTTNNNYKDNNNNNDNSNNDDNNDNDINDDDCDSGSSNNDNNNSNNNDNNDNDNDNNNDNNNNDKNHDKNNTDDNNSNNHNCIGSVHKNKNDPNSSSHLIKFLKSKISEIFAGWCLFYSVVFSLLAFLVLFCLLSVCCFFYGLFR